MWWVDGGRISGNPLRICVLNNPLSAKRNTRNCIQPAILGAGKVWVDGKE